MAASPAKERMLSPLQRNFSGNFRLNLGCKLGRKGETRRGNNVDVLWLSWTGTEEKNGVAYREPGYIWRLTFWRGSVLGSCGSSSLVNFLQTERKTPVVLVWVATTLENFQYIDIECAIFPQTPNNFVSNFFSKSLNLHFELITKRAS